VFKETLVNLFKGEWILWKYWVIKNIKN
jgi:hypothetical protein